MRTTADCANTYIPVVLKVVGQLLRTLSRGVRIAIERMAGRKEVSSFAWTGSVQHSRAFPGARKKYTEMSPEQHLVFYS